MTISTDARTLRMRLLPAVMLALLLVSLGAAWLLVRGRQSAVDRGAEIVAAVRQAGPASYWRKNQTMWFLARQAGKDIGWRVDLREIADDESVSGLSAVLMPDPRQRQTQWEWWDIDARAAKGAYSGQNRLSVRGNLVYSLSIAAALENGVITVQQDIAGQLTRNQAKVPANYIPEGTLWFAITQVAVRRTSATLEMVIDSLPQTSTTTRLARIRLEYAGTRDGNSLVKLIFGGEEQTFVIDSKGRIIRIETSEMTFDQVGKDKLLEAFPNAIGVLRMLIEQQQMPFEIPGEPVPPESETQSP